MEQAHGRMIGFQLVTPAQSSGTNRFEDSEPPFAPRADVAHVERRGVGWRLTHAGAAIGAVILARRAAALAAQMPEKEAADTSKFLLSPMPGLLVSLAVKAGQHVRAGEELAVVEAMKMQNVLRAEQDGTVKTLHAKPGESLAVDQAIIEFA